MNKFFFRFRFILTYISLVILKCIDYQQNFFVITFTQSELKLDDIKVPSRLLWQLIILINLSKIERNLITKQLCMHKAILNISIN